MSSDNAPRGKDHHPRLGRRGSDHPDDHKSYGRRATDEPQVTMSRKFIVIVVAAINALYFAGNTFLNITHLCGGG
jgi:hypothetical protein